MKKRSVLSFIALNLAFLSFGVVASQAQDFSGKWIMSDGGLFIGIDLPYTVEGQNLVADRIQLVKEGRSMASPHLTCRPTGTAGLIAAKAPVLIQQKENKIYMVFQEDREVRFVHMNEERPENPELTYSGYSTGRWEGNTLVIETSGFNGLGQIDEVANPQSEQSRVIERWTKSDDGNTIEIDITITDPVYYTEPFNVVRVLRKADGARIGDYDCGENPLEEDFDRMTFIDDRLKPACVRPTIDGMISDKVVCTHEN